MNARLRANLVVGQFVSVLQLLSSKDQALLFQGNASSVGNLVLERVNGVGISDAKQQMLRVGILMIHHENGHGTFTVADTSASDSVSSVGAAQVFHCQRSAAAVGSCCWGHGC